uniref:Uncharacterized protein n=1 Tax=Theileria annulata TaxID=5874 RepID=A0A3B0N1K4_THEAN
MQKDVHNKQSKLLKFSKLNCLWNPEESKNPKLYDSYSYLDLHLNQFLSNITEDYSFLPNTIYKPSIHVFIDNRLVYKTKILDFNNDLFDETIRLKIYSQNTTVTLKLFEYEQFNTTNSEELNLKPSLYSERTDLHLVSWVDLDINLLIPERDYKIICAFKSNPSFNSYNPGGILYYPTESNRPSILFKRVCASCKVCSLLSHLSVGDDDQYSSIFKYFDYKFKDPNSDSSDLKEEVKDKEKSVDEEDLDVVEVIDMSSLTKRSRKESCKCLQLRYIPLSFKKKNFEICLKCHDYEVCCDHTLNNYYLSVNFKLIPSSDKIDFSTELFSCLLSSKQTELKCEDLASIFEILYQRYYSFQLLFNHIKEKALLFLKFSLLSLVLGSSAFFFVVRITSTTQFKKDHGDILYTSKNLYTLDQGVSNWIMKYIEDDVKEKPLIVNGRVYTVDKKSIERNNLNIPERHIVDKTKVYTKAHSSYKRTEYIALKTICYAISESIPKVVKAFLLKIAEVSEHMVVFINGVLALTRDCGLQLSFTCFFLAVTSFKFYKLYSFIVKLLLVLLLLGSFAQDVDHVRYAFTFVRNLFVYLVLRVYRKEWFLNA